VSGGAAGMRGSNDAPRAWTEHRVWAPVVMLLAVCGEVLAHAPFDAPEAAYVMLVPLILWLMRERPLRFTLWFALGAGWLSWFARIAWLRHFQDSVPLPLEPFIGWGSAILLAAVLAVFWAAWVLVVRWVMPRVAPRGAGWRIAGMACIASAWVVMEWIRSWAFTGFPWLPLAATQWQRPLVLQIASVTGAWGVSFLLVYFNAAIALYVRALLTVKRGTSWWQRLSPELYSALLLLFGAVLAGVGPLGGPARMVNAFRVGFVQPYLSIEEKWNRESAQAVLDDLEQVTVMASYLEPDLILWPEAPAPFPIKGSEMMRGWIEELARRVETPLLVGNIAVEFGADGADERWYNAVFHVDPQAGAAVDSYYSKRHLVPFGEYVPLARVLPFLSKVVPHGGNFYRGDAPVLQPIRVGGTTLRFGPLVCYEDVFPQLARASVRAGADVLFVATNNVWFGEGAGAYQHAAHSVLRAVENRRPVLRCGNGGWSGWIDENGVIRHVVTGPDNSIYVRKVDVIDFGRSAQWAGRESFYTRHGDWFVWLCIGLAAAIAIVVRGLRGIQA